VNRAAARFILRSHSAGSKGCDRLLFQAGVRDVAIELAVEFAVIFEFAAESATSAGCLGIT